MAKIKAPTPQELYLQRKQREEREKLAYLPPGLINHGNTCFMNSVLQGLIATRLLSDLVHFNSMPPEIQGVTSTHIASRRSPQLTNGHNLAGIYEQPWVNTMPIGDMFLSVMYKSWDIQANRRREILSPRALLAVLGQKYDQYLDFAQQDAHEFLRILLDAMRMEELDIIKKRQPPTPNHKKRRRTTLTPNNFNSVKDSNPSTPALTSTSVGSSTPAPHDRPDPEPLMSFADMLFGGKLTSILVCQKCKHISQTYEDFNDISLSIKPEDYFFGHSNGGRKRDKLKMLAKKLTIFPGSGGGGSQATRTPNLNTNSTTMTTEGGYQATHMSMDIQRPSSVPPSPSRPRAGDGNAHSDGEGDGHSSLVEFPRRKSLDLVKTSLVGTLPRANVDVETASSSGAEADIEVKRVGRAEGVPPLSKGVALSRMEPLEQGDNRWKGYNDNAEDEIIMESDSSHVLVHVALPEERHVELIEPTEKEDKDKKENAGWARLGRRISVTVGLGRSKDKEKMRSKERVRKRWSSGLVKEKVDTAGSTDGSMQKSVDDSGFIEGTSGFDAGLEKPRISSRGTLRRSQTATAVVGMSSKEVTSAILRPMAISSLSSSGSVSTAAFKLFKPLPRAPSSLNTSTLNARVTPTVASQPQSSQDHNQNLEAPSGAHHPPNNSSTRLPLLSNVQRSRSPKPPKPTAAESEYLGKVLADVVSSSSGLHSSFSLFKPPTLMLSGTHPFSTSGSSSGGGGAGMWLGLHHFSGIEECLRLFTAVEVLDGENMVGCRRCWKIVNGMLDAGSTKQEEGDSDQEQEQEEHYDMGQHERQVRESSLISQGNQDQVVMANGGGLKKQRPKLEALSTAIINGPTHIPTSASTPTVSFYTLPNSSDSRSISSLPTEATSISDSNEDPSFGGFSLKESGDTPRGPGDIPIPTISTTSPLESPLTARTSFAHAQHLAASAKESMVEPFVMDRAGENNRSINGVLSDQDHSINPSYTSNLSATYPLSSITSSLLTQQVLAGYNASGSKDSLLIPKISRHQRRRIYDSSTSPSASTTDNEGGSDDEESDTSVGTSVSGESSASASVTNNRAASLSRLQGQQQAPGAAQSQQMKPREKKPKPVIMRPAYKRYLISLPPPVLVIHLKRFQQTSKMPLISFSHGLKKLDDYVSFPEYLDLKPFLAPKKEDYGLGKKKRKGVAKGKAEKCIYRLYAVVVHIGNMLGGHYIAYTALPSVNSSTTGSCATPEEVDPTNAKSESTEEHSKPTAKPTSDERQWAFISDTVVRLTTLEEVLRAKAYICMYERC